jgi:hypothetical protein
LRCGQQKGEQGALQLKLLKFKLCGVSPKRALRDLLYNRRKHEAFEASGRP